MRSTKKKRSPRTSDFVLQTFAILLLLALPAAAAEHFGRVTFNGLPVPGATVTAAQRDQQLVTVTDQDGVFRLASVADGAWTVRVEMIGFSTLSREVAILEGAPPSTWELKMLPLAEMTRGLQPAPAVAAPAAAPTTNAPAPAAPAAGFQRAQVGR